MNITRFSPQKQGPRNFVDQPPEGMVFDSEGRFVSYAMHRALYDKMEERALLAESKLFAIMALEKLPYEVTGEYGPEHIDGWNACISKIAAIESEIKPVTPPPLDHPVCVEALREFENYLHSIGGPDSSNWHDAPVDGVFIEGFNRGVKWAKQKKSSKCSHAEGHDFVAQDNNVAVCFNCGEEKPHIQLQPYDGIGPIKQLGGLDEYSLLVVEAEFDEALHDYQHQIDAFFGVGDDDINIHWNKFNKKG